MNPPCIHDADAAGTMIYETLVEETRARAKRRIEVVNLGLEPWQALAMGLESEKVERGERRTAVASYVSQSTDWAHWGQWLQEYRVEMNEMTAPQFVAWLDGEMAKHGVELAAPGGLGALDCDPLLDVCVEFYGVIRADVMNQAARKLPLFLIGDGDFGEPVTNRRHVLRSPR